MTSVNIEEAQADLNRLLEQAVRGEPFLITRSDKPPVRIEAVEVSEPGPAAPRRLGFLEGMYPVPDDIKGPFREEIEAMFGLAD